MFGIVDTQKLTSSKKRKALEAVNLIEKKRSSKIKGRIYVNGSKQKRYLETDESISSPTVSLEAILGTLIIDVYEVRETWQFLTCQEHTYMLIFQKISMF